jgi:hypothetical protein
MWMHVHGATLHHVGESTHVQDSPIMMLGGPEHGSIVEYIRRVWRAAGLGVSSLLGINRHRAALGSCFELRQGARTPRRVGTAEYLGQRHRVSLRDH